MYTDYYCLQWVLILSDIFILYLLCINSSIIDLLRKGYQGLKSAFGQLILAGTYSGSKACLVSFGLGFDSPHNQYLK